MPAIQTDMTMEKSSFDFFNSKSQEILQVFEYINIVLKQSHLQPSVLGDKHNS